MAGRTGLAGAKVWVGELVPVALLCVSNASSVSPLASTHFTPVTLLCGPVRGDAGLAARQTRG